MHIVERLRTFEGSDDLGNGDFSLLIQAAQHIRVLEALLAECAADLRAEIERTYPPEARLYPVIQRRFDRDMQPVLMAEALLPTPLHEAEKA